MRARKLRAYIQNDLYLLFSPIANKNLRSPIFLSVSLQSACQCVCSSGRCILEPLTKLRPNDQDSTSAMILGVISDTHGQVDTTARAIEIMKCREAEQVVHCGDVGGTAIIELFRGLPTHFVVGNCDNAVTLQMSAEAAGHTFHGRIGELSLLGRRISFLHGDSPYALERLLAEDQCDLIAHGHTHLASCQRYGSTLILNPGAMTRCSQPSIALVRLPDLEITVVPVESA